MYYAMRALASVNNLQEKTTKGLVTYAIRRGYDAEDLLKLGTIPGDLGRAVHLIMLICYSYPNIKNKSFNTLLTSFIHEAIQSKNLTQLQAHELYKALYYLKNFK